jgi:RCC1 and BTB domain-containing protein
MNYEENSPGDMTGQKSSSGGSMAGCDLNESIFSPQSTQRDDRPTGGVTNGLIVFSWGRGEDGQLGLGDTSDQHEPTFLDALRGVAVRQLACGSGHTCILTQDGEVFSWGRGDDGRLGHGDNGWKYVPRLVNALSGKVVTQITCGSYHTAAVTNNGELFTWGGGMYGKLGHGSESGCSTPRKVEGLSDVHVGSVACGSRHTVAVTSNGAIYSWGDKENGVAGHASTEGHQYTPKVVDKLLNKNVVQLSACGFHTGCITDEKQVYIWGEGKFGRLGLGSERNCHSPRLIEDFTGTNAKQIACGGFHTAVVTDDGKVYTFGGGEHGQLGHGDKFNRVVPTLVQALENEHISQITCGWSHTVVLTPRGVCSFGNGEHGKLGHGTIKKLSTPSLVEKLKGHRVVSIASYNEHTAALVEPLHDSGAVWGAFGTNTVPVTTSFLRNMRDMVDNDEFSDVIFKVDNDFVYAHKSILASRCEHFAALLRSGMRETVEGEITIPNVTKPVFLLLMEYIYTDSVMIDMEYAVDLYVLADMYGLERLSNICVTVVKRNLSTFNATGILQHATDEDCIVLKDLAMEFVISNFERISKTDGIRLVSHEVLLDILSNRP